jgi:hypothetical protein
LSSIDKEHAVRNAKYQMVFFLTSIALLWYDSVNPPRAALHQVSWQISASGQ